MIKLIWGLWVEASVRGSMLPWISKKIVKCLHPNLWVQVVSVQRHVLGISNQRENTAIYVNGGLLLLHHANQASWKRPLKQCCCLGHCHRHDSKIVKIVSRKMMHVDVCTPFPVWKQTQPVSQSFMLLPIDRIVYHNFSWWTVRSPVRSG